MNKIKVTDHLPEIDTVVWLFFEDEPAFQGRYVDHRYCMIGGPAGYCGEGFIDEENKLPVEVTYWCSLKEYTMHSPGASKFDMAHPNAVKKPLQANLMPCPFCGSADINFSGCYPNAQYYIQCEDCRANLWADRRDKALGMWNRRTLSVSQT